MMMILATVFHVTLINKSQKVFELGMSPANFQPVYADAHGFYNWK